MPARAIIGCKLLALAMSLSVGVAAATDTPTATSTATSTAESPPVKVISRDDPQVLLQEATAELLAISKAARDYVDQDRERYYAQVSAVLEQVVDIEYFARGVMATYASARLYRSLESDAQRVAFRARVERFTSALKRVWMVKYADALLLADGETIDIERLSASTDSGDRASLKQTVHDRQDKSYNIQYSLRKSDAKAWLIVNVILEGVNLGEIYRSQFAEAVENHRGDVDYVVEHWVSLMLHSDEGVTTREESG